MTKSAGKTKYQVIFDDLREAIRTETYGADDQLPSERDLAQTYGVTRTTARRALRDLEQMGLVRRDGARGTRVVPDTNGARTEILSLVCTNEPLAAGIEFLRLATLIADQHGWGFRIVRLSFEESLALLRSLKVGNPHIIYTERMDFSDQSKLTEALSQTRTPTVAIGNDLSTRGVPSIVCDDVAGMQLALDHLSESGHTQIALVSGREEVSHPVLRTMVEAWETQIKGHMPANQIFRHLVRMENRPFESLTMEAFDVVRAYLRSAVSKNITAMICLKEELAVGAMAACRDVGRVVPDAMSLVEYAPTPRAKLATLPRTSIDVRLDRHVRKAFQLLANRESTSSATPKLRYLIKPTLVPGESVRNL